MQSNRERVLAWVQAGLIEDKNIAQALQLAKAQPDRLQWYQFIKRALMWLVVICACSGVIFFFAYNWQALSRTLRFVLVQSAMLIISFSYLHCSANEKLKVALLMAMVLLTGSLLALVGQTYQTGADPWQLFAAWWVLMTPWAMLGRSSVIWIFWLLLLNVSYLLFSQLHLSSRWIIFEYQESSLLELGVINALLLVFFECICQYQQYAKTRLPVLLVPRQRYLQQVLHSVVLVYLSGWSMASLFEYNTPSYWVFLYLAASLLIYRYLITDLFAITVTCFSFLAVSYTLLFHYLDETNTEFGTFVLLSAIYLLLLSSVIGLYLRRCSELFLRAAGSPQRATEIEGDW